MTNLLVTGGAGFIGANFVHFWKAAHPADHIVILDALTYAGNLASLTPVLDMNGATFVQGSVCNQDLVDTLFREHAITAVVHFAAETHVDRSIHGPDQFIETNVLGTHTVLKAARAAWLEAGNASRAVRFHQVSTDEVYGSLGPDDPPFTEASPYAPNSPYAASKAAADHLVRAYHQTYGLPTTTSNCSNNYGPYQFPEKLIPLMIINALEGRPLPIYGDGLNIRDWLHVEDHCRALECVLLRGRVGETYNVGGRSEWRNVDIVRALCRTLDEALRNDERLRQRFPRSPATAGKSSETLLTFVKDRPGHDRRYAIDDRKIEALGFTPQLSFETGLRATVAWYLKNEAWWSDVMDGTYRDWIKRNYSTVSS